MKSSNIEESVKDRLIIAGIGEIEEHGVSDFSLRRVALSARVSCAAPYRHFKDKQALIRAIIEYIASKWNLMLTEIEKVFKSDTKTLVRELLFAYLRFWFANPNFRSVLTSALPQSEEETAFSVFDLGIMEKIDKYCDENGISDKEEKKYVARALTYGTVMLGDEDRDRKIANFNEKIKKEFS